MQLVCFSVVASSLSSQTDSLKYYSKLCTSLAATSIEILSAKFHCRINWRLKSVSHFEMRWYNTDLVLSGNVKDCWWQSTSDITPSINALENSACSTRSYQMSHEIYFQDKTVHAISSKNLFTKSNELINELEALGLHTSAKARLATVIIWIRIRIRIPDVDCHQSLTICSLAHCQPS